MCRQICLGLGNLLVAEASGGAELLFFRLLGGFELCVGGGFGGCFGVCKEGFKSS